MGYGEAVSPVRSAISITVVATVLATVLAGGGLAACGGSRGDQRLVVFAASSLTESMTAIEAAFEAEHPGVDVVISFDGSAALAAQIGQGAPVDVFASADQASMGKVSDLASGTPQTMATNRLVIAVSSGNPRDVTGLADLAADHVPSLIVVLAAPEVPAGRYAAEVLSRAGVVAAPASLEQNVRAAASKVALGEADAAIVYVTDVTAQPDVLEAVTIPPDSNVIAEYPIVAVTEAPLAAEFVEMVRSPVGQAALTAAGFGLP